MNNKDKTYDVIILTYEPKEELIRSIELLLSQSIKPTSIIICNTDKESFYKNIVDKERLENIIKSHSEISDTMIKVIHIDKSDFDHGKTRNFASSFAKSNYIMFMTDDAIPYDLNLTSNLIDAFYNYDKDGRRVAVSYARQVAKVDSKLKEKYIREFNYPDYDILKDKSTEKKYGIKNYFCSNVCAMYDASIFSELGRFEENIILNEDTFYVYNAINNGYTVVYKSDAIVYHSHDFTYQKQLNRNFDIGVSQIDKKVIFDSIPVVSEGKRMAFGVTMRLIKGFHFFSAIDFLIECIYRYIGHIYGKNYKNLSIERCIKLSNNKEYFIKMSKKR